MREHKDNKDSMLFWYPKIKYLDIPQPKTEFILLSPAEYYATMDGMPHSITNRVSNIIESKFRLPVFIRTDFASAKHQWKESCYYDGSGKLWRHLLNICEFNHCVDGIAGLPFSAIVIREFIEMDSKYKAFKDMPVNPERRYFIKDGKVICHHSYWIKEAILNPSVANWEKLSDEMNIETPEEIKLLTKYSEMVTHVMKGFWSIDFCKSKRFTVYDARWILIDMATGKRSWHPEICKNYYLKNE
jgi:hypothetical protein